MDIENTQPAEKKTRHRSPSYPTIGLRESVERLEKLYTTDGKAGAPPEIAVKHMGFASAHGQAMSALAALKKFGLVSDVNGRIVPSQRGVEIVRLPKEDPRRLQALKDAAVSPSIYRELVEQHKETGLPGEGVLESELETYRGFNPNAVIGFVKDFKDTLEFSGLSDLSALELSQEDESMSNDELVANTANQPARPPLQPSSAQALAEKAARYFMAQKSVGQISTPVGKQDGQVVFAHVNFDAEITKEFVSSLKKYLDYLETTLN
jgi:hypothetical protein